MSGQDVAVAPRVTESAMAAALMRFYGERMGGARRYAVATHPDAHGRIADFVAVDAWGRDKHAVIGHEIKVSRADWLAELRAPEKAEAWKRYCRRWWLVVPDEDIVRDDLPKDWGLIVVRHSLACAVVAAPPLKPEPMPWSIAARLMRAVAQTHESAVHV